MLDANVLIVGAGLAGASTAFHLARLGIERVMLIERESVAGVHASGRNAAMVRSVVEDQSLQPMLHEGAVRLRAGALAPFRRVGGFLIGHGQRDDVSTLVPFARGRGLHVAEDGVVDVAALLQRYLRGQDVRYETTLTGFASSHDRVDVETTRGMLRAHTLVNAAGPWAGEIGQLPLEPLVRHLYVTPPNPAIDQRWPFVWDIEHGLYFRPESGGLLLCPCDEALAAPGDYTERVEAMGLLAEKLERHQPDLDPLIGGLRVMHRWAGQRTFAADRRFVIGFDPRQPRLFWVAGLGGHGVTASPAVGRLAAELLGRRSPRSHAFAPDRLLEARARPSSQALSARS